MANTRRSGGDRREGGCRRLFNEDRDIHGLPFPSPHNPLGMERRVKDRRAGERRFPHPDYDQRHRAERREEERRWRGYMPISNDRKADRRKAERRAP